MIPYGRQSVDREDIEAVVRVLESDWLTTGPAVEEFEESFAQKCGATHAVAVSSGTAALHAMLASAGIGPGDEVIVPPLTFIASVNAAVYVGAKPVFADVDPESLLLDPDSVAARLSPRTRAVIAVDYAGHPCDYEALRSVTDGRDMFLFADGCHALGGGQGDRSVGVLADATTFSLHPVKHVTAGEGGVVTTDNNTIAERLICFRNHGITSDHQTRAARDSWVYEVERLGFNYRITDFQCALAGSQLRKLDQWVGRRKAIAAAYDLRLGGLKGLSLLKRRGGFSHAYHLYVVRFRPDAFSVDRARIFEALRAEGIGVNVHYIPVYYHPFYKNLLGDQKGLCPVAEDAYEQIISLPIFPAMADSDIDDVLAAIKKVIAAWGT
jgi:perosamine synthetase